MALTSPARTLIIGSRGSQLALWQAHFIAKQLKQFDVDTRIEIIKTTGDHLQTASLTQAGGKGLFTKEIEEALLNGGIDLAVHSLKDLPTQMPAGLAIAAIPEREDPRDALVGRPLDNLPKGSRVGTSSGRRVAQLLRLRPDLNLLPIRGNVDTRLRKLRENQFDAIVLAAAGLHRLGLSGEIAEICPPEQICPAPGQGALAIQTRAGDPARQICAALNSPQTERAVCCERAILAALGGGCQMPIGAFAEPSGESLRVYAIVLSPDGSWSVQAGGEGFMARWEELAQQVANELLGKGAAAILASNG